MKSLANRSSRSATAAAFQARAERASALALVSKSGAEALRFSAALFDAQSRIADTLEELHAREPLAGRLSHDGPRIIAPLLAILPCAARSAPAQLSAQARARARENPNTVRVRLAICWNRQRGEEHDYLSRAMLRPWAEVLRAHAITPDRPHHAGHCPFCGGPPAVGCRRPIAEGEGSQRLLICICCGLEWPWSRVRCPVCFEADPQKLPSFTTPDRPSARIEACETCRKYVKVIDLAQDPRALPEVDDLDSIGLDLWAVEKGFVRLEPGLAGI
ncbi:MAG TPA: formate dehydrogenase accessory protein FdhE [Planctomycetota bacterium]|nr:formate dehydrogenase accessory protein FdhE [Planctomycetota bacterium]